MSEDPHVVCPACDAVNRVPRSRLGVGAKCGKCHGPLFTGMPLALDEGRFARHLARSDLPAGRFLGALVWSLPDDGAGLRLRRRPAGASGAADQGQHRGGPEPGGKTRDSQHSDSRPLSRRRRGRAPGRCHGHKWHHCLGTEGTLSKVVEEVVGRRGKPDPAHCLEIAAPNALG